MENCYAYGYGIVTDINNIYEICNTDDIDEISEFCKDQNYSFYYNKKDDKCFISLINRINKNGDNMDLDFDITENDMKEFEAIFGYEADFNVFILDEDDNVMSDTSSCDFEMDDQELEDFIENIKIEQN